MADFWLSSEPGGPKSETGYVHDPSEPTEDTVALFESMLKKHSFVVVTFYRGIW